VSGVSGDRRRGSSRSAGGRLQAGPTGLEADPSELRDPPDAAQLDTIFGALSDAHGPQQWWPTASEDGEQARLEICLGAILTQNTAWRAAARALERLRALDAIDCDAILDLPQDVLADLVRPSGHYNVKARKLHAFAQTVVEQHDGSLDALMAGTAVEVRERLLAIWGIGPETADAMTLYAARLPTFVIDAYAYRLFERLGRPLGPRRYDVYREFLLEAIGPDVHRLNEWHALIVRHGQETCRRTRPHCDECVLLDQCEFGQAETGRSEVVGGARAAPAR
jgi:endonuclease-3 related protein